MTDSTAIAPLTRRSVLLAPMAGLAAVNWVSAARAAEGTLRRGNRYEPASLDPHKINTQYESNIVADLFEGLVTYDVEGRPVPGVAESWIVGEDARRYTFRLRAKLAWSDGAPLTAEDVVYTFRRLMNPNTAANYAQLMYLIKNGRAVNTGAMPVDSLGVSAIDAQTVVMELESPAPYLPEILANAFAAMVPRHAIAKHGDVWAKPGTIVSNGAFTLDTWKPQDHIALAHNPRFHGAGESTLARVVYVPTADLASGLARFRAGELDMQLDFPVSQIDKLRAEMSLETKLTPSLLTYYLALNTGLPKFADAKVRRALSLAVDRDILAAKVLRAGEQPALSFVPPATANYQPSSIIGAAQPADVRLAEARRLLAEAGYGPERPLKLTYSHSSNLELRRIAVVIAGMWKRAGVEASLFNTEGKVHFANLREGNYEAAFVGWSADFNDASSFLYVLESRAVNSNYSRYHNPEFESLMARAALMENAGVRANLLRQAEAVAMNDQPVIPLYFGVTKDLVSQHVIGWRPNPIGMHLSRYLSVVR
jgi:oligopeptide transport system substrate-binding protein